MRKIVIAPSSMHENLLNLYRKDNPFSDIKIIDKKQILSDYFGYCLKGADIEVFKKFKLSYEMVLEIIKDIPFIEDKKDDKFNLYYDIKQYLVANDLYKINELYSIAYSNSEIHIYGYSKEDRILNICLKDLKSNIHYLQLGNEIKNKVVYSFKYASDESLLVLNEIARLIDQGVNIEDIYIYNPSESHSYYLKKYMNHFRFKINNLDRKTYFTSGICLEFLKKYDEIRDINESIIYIQELIKEDRDLDGFISLIKENIDDSLDYIKQRELLIYAFKNTYIPSAIYKPAVNVIDGPILDENAHIFVMNFSLGSAPRIIKDNGYLSDKEKDETNIYLSKERNENLRYELLSFLKSNANFYFSYSSLVNNENTYPTSLIREFGFKEINNPKITTFYSQKLMDLTYIQALDLYDAYLQKSEELMGLEKLTSISYKTYDNQFNGTKAIKDDTKLTFSYTALDKYFSCPFNYYLKYVLGIEEFEETLSLTLGNLIHEIFSHQYEDGFDFDKTFDNYLSSLTLSKKDRFFVSKLKDSFKLASEAAREHINKYSAESTLFLEKELLYTIDENTVLIGKVDKIVTLDNRYFYVVDYKTGSKTFTFNYLENGKDTQLVIYSILCESFEELDNLTLGGLYINYVSPTELTLSSSEEEKIIPSYLKLKGPSLRDNNYLLRADKTFEGASQASFINGIRLKNDGSLHAKSTCISTDEFEQYKNTVKELIRKANASIRENDFKIAPKFYGKNGPCQYCNFKDICFKRFEQIDFVVEEEDEEEKE